MFIQGVHRAIIGLTGVPVVKRVSTSLVKDKNTLKLHNYPVTVKGKNIPKIKVPESHVR